MQQRVVGQVPSARIHTRTGASGPPRSERPRRFVDVPDVDRARDRRSSQPAPWPLADPLAEIGQRLRVGHALRRRLGVLHALSGSWNDADSAKIASPCWMATTRRVVKDRPSRTRSTS